MPTLVNNEKQRINRVINNEKLLAAKKHAAVTAHINARQIENNLKEEQKKTQLIRNRKVSRHDFDDNLKPQNITQTANTTEQAKPTNLVEDNPEFNPAAAVQDALNTFKAALDPAKFLAKHNVRMATEADLLVIEADSVKSQQRDHFVSTINTVASDEAEDAKLPVYEEEIKITNKFTHTVAGSVVADSSKSNDERNAAIADAGQTLKEARAEFRKNLRNIVNVTLDNGADEASKQLALAQLLLVLDSALGGNRLGAYVQQAATQMADGTLETTSTNSTKATVLDLYETTLECIRDLFVPGPGAGASISEEEEEEQAQKKRNGLFKGI